MMIFFSRVLGLDTVIDINMKSKHPGTVLVSEGRMKQVMNSQTDRCCGEQNMKAKGQAIIIASPMTISCE